MKIQWVWNPLSDESKGEAALLRREYEEALYYFGRIYSEDLLRHGPRESGRRKRQRLLTCLREIIAVTSIARATEDLAHELIALEVGALRAKARRYAGDYPERIRHSALFAQGALWRRVAAIVTVLHIVHPDRLSSELERTEVLRLQEHAAIAQGHCQALGAWIWKNEKDPDLDRMMKDIKELAEDLRVGTDEFQSL